MKLSRIAFPLIAASLLASAAHADQPLSKADVEAIVKSYIAEHPEALMDSLKNYQQKQAADTQANAGKAIVERKADLFADAASPVAGNRKGDVTLVEFFDYHCGYCKKMVPTVSQLIKSDSKLRVVFKELPILSPDSRTAALAALAVYRLKPEKYFDYHTALMSTSGAFSEDMLAAEAQKLGIDGAALKKEMAKPELEAQLKKTEELAVPLGIRGTPAFIVGDKIIPGAASEDALKQAIADTRKGGGGAAPAKAGKERGKW